MNHPPHPLRTVLGPLSPTGIRGPVLAHEHLALDLDRTGHRELDGDRDLDGDRTRTRTRTRDRDRAAVLDPAAHGPQITRELTALREEFGLALVVELTCRGMGRDAAALARISAASGVAVIAATGWYYEPFHPEEIGDASVERLAGTLIREINGGIGTSGIRPGVIGEVGSHGDTPSEPETRSLLAAARAAVTTGLSVSTHAQLGRGGLAQLDLLTGAGLAPHRIAIGHQDLLDDPSVHRELAASGAYVAFDTVGKDSYQSDTTRLRLLVGLIEAGYADRALLSCDISRHGYLESEGGQGYGHLFRSFLKEARAAGVDEDLIDLMTRRNPVRFLTGRTTEEA
ncbi:phosphotriesterase [Streptomyces monticola]|uniref:Phosphotriesterase n=1 Tax=Streptomyces monticola TaxID=2666263 RepID=A0ABW2JSE8_9ACTN